LVSHLFSLLLFLGFEWFFDTFFVILDTLKCSVRVWWRPNVTKWAVDPDMAAVVAVEAVVVVAAILAAATVEAAAVAAWCEAVEAVPVLMIVTWEEAEVEAHPWEEDLDVDLEEEAEVEAEEAVWKVCKSTAQIRAPNSPIRSPNSPIRSPNSGSQIRVLNRGPKSGAQIGVPIRGLTLIYKLLKIL
jgi:hypothetical protein